MTAITIALTVVVLILIALVVSVGMVTYLRSKPGLRRRGEDPSYCGEKRRSSDKGCGCGNHRKDEATDGGHDTMTTTERNTQGK